MKQIIYTENAPDPIGPYSQAVISNGTLYVSGQIAINEDGDLVVGDITAETTIVMQNIKAILEAAGVTFDNVIKSSIFLTSMDDFDEMNEVYGSYFTADFPARECVEVSRLPKDKTVNVEISVIATVG
jgi:2-iminobutanoate/2-iminopropanoate deaminase